MKSAIHSVTIVLLHFFIFAGTCATAIDLQKGKKRGFTRALEGLCDTEIEELVACVPVETIDCAYCSLDAMTANVVDGAECNSLQDTAFCSDLQAGANEKCPESCHDKLHASMTCYLRMLGCTGNECSAGFKANTMIYFAAGAIFFMRWMMV